MEKIRLQKYMALCGVASRRECEKIISEGRVIVNGIKVTEQGLSIDPGRDKILVNGKSLSEPEKFTYIMFNKPAGVVTTSKDQFGRKCVSDYFSHLQERVYPVGRLDYDTEGLLVMTNDGEFTYKLTHPAHEIGKTYIVKTDGEPSDDDIEKLRNGIDIDGDGRLTSKAYVERLTKNSLKIIIHEGRNRQIRKMCQCIGYPVIKLKRTAIGKLNLDVKKGEWRYLEKADINKIFMRI